MKVNKCVISLVNNHYYHNNLFDGRILFPIFWTIKDKTAKVLGTQFKLPIFNQTLKEVKDINENKRT